MGYPSDNQVWNIEFIVESLKYTGFANKIKKGDEVHYNVSYCWEENPNLKYTGSFYPKKGSGENENTIEWECHNRGIKPKFIKPIGNAIEKKVKKTGLSIF